jgi:telomere length regulation protein
LPPLDPHLVALSQHAKFIQAVQAYLFHSDAKIRRLGMLVAEIISDRTIVESDDTGPNAEEEMEDLRAGLEVDDETGESSFKPPKPPRGAKKLKFTGIWDGSGQGQEECAWLRRCVGVRDADAPIGDDPEAWLLGWTAQPDEPPAPSAQPPPQPKERGRASKPKAEPKAKPKIVMLDDDQAADPLEAYASSAASSRSPSPTPSFLDEVAADPSLAIDATKKRKLKRPVYVRQLTELLRDKDKPESIELALQWGEGLVRAKRGFGTEVSDNAVAVAASALALANPFNLDDFESRRQGLVTALVVCSPRNVPPLVNMQMW